MKYAAPLLGLALLFACSEPAAPAAPVTPSAPAPAPSSAPAPPPASTDSVSFEAAATAYCKHERPLVLEDPIQKKAIEKIEAEAGKPATIRDEAAWMPSCVQRQGQLAQKMGADKVMQYFTCASNHDSLVMIRTECFRKIFPKPEIKKGP